MKKVKSKVRHGLQMQGGGGNKVLAHTQHPFANGVPLTHSAKKDCCKKGKK